ncbi:MAG: hypothetical protein HYR64_02270 [Fimbriimonas ginsengisoli]|uniref:Uncharacterized protein n=1 Tax=Fimbriimonas ginsengisoli TaxID=1005039 RepID=A0A931LR28_FIMGI|nr:hypothetical protein [Fimbriimonas ginsengisoli]
MSDKSSTEEAIARLAVRFGLANRVATAERAPALRGVEISVCASPDAGASLDVDLVGVKAALLYADSVRLCSPAASLVGAIRGLAKLDLHEKLAFLREIGPICDPSRADELANILAEVERRFRTRPKTRADFLLRRELHEIIEREWDAVSRMVEQIGDDHGFAELELATSRNLLEVVTFSDWHSVEAAAEAWFQWIVDSCKDPYTIPLLDDTAATLIRSALDEGIVVINREQTPLQKHGALAAKLFQRLPAFPQLTVAETLELRADIETYLARFRSAMLRLSETARSESWDPDFLHEVEQIFLREVQPGVDDIQAKLRDHRLTRTLYRAIYATPSTQKAAIAITIANAPLVAKYVAAVYAAIGLASATMREFDVRQRALQEVRQHGLFLYHEVTTKLGG